MSKRDDGTAPGTNRPFDTESFLMKLRLPVEAELRTWAETPLRPAVVVSLEAEGAEPWLVKECGNAIRLLPLSSSRPKRFPTYRNALEVFLRLARPEATEEAFRRFAAAYGLLGVDDQGSLLGVYRGERDYLTDELIWWHRYYARLARAIMRLARACHGETPVYLEPLWVIREHTRRLLSETWDALEIVADVVAHGRGGVVGQGRALADADDVDSFLAAVWATSGPEGSEGYVTAAGWSLRQILDENFSDVLPAPPWPPLSPREGEDLPFLYEPPCPYESDSTIPYRESLRALVSAAIDQWSARGHVAPRIEWDANGPRIVWTGGLWGALAMQMVAQVRFGAGAAWCHRCHEEVKRKRAPKLGQLSWCKRPECQQYKAKIGMRRLAERRRNGDV